MEGICDDTDLTFCFLEKNRLNIIKSFEPEEMLTCNGYLAESCNLNITTIKLDELLFKPPDIKPEVNDYVIRIEMCVLLASISIGFFMQVRSYDVMRMRNCQ